MDTTSTTIPGFITGGTGLPSSGAYAPIPTPYNSSGSIGSTFGLSSLASTFVQILTVMSLAALVGIVIIAVVASRSEPDPTGRRPQSVYFFVVSFVTLTSAIFGSALVVGVVLLLTANVSNSVSHALDRVLLLSVLIMVVSGVLLAVHLRRGLANARAESHVVNPSKRVGQSYVSVVAFTSVLVLLVAAILSLYLVFAIAAPGTFGSFGGRSWATRFLIESLYVGAVAAFVIWRHGSMLDPTLSGWRSSDGASSSTSSAPADGPPASGGSADVGP